MTSEWLFSESWYSCYKRGISCMEGECWDAAKGEFERALQKREKDGRWVLTYGMHRLPEYFPNRELGIVYFNLHDLDSAKEYLTISLGQCESAKAKYYLNRVRREILILMQEDREPPFLSIDPYPQRMATSSLCLSGKAWDDTFVANVMIQVNDGEPLSLMELSRPLSHKFKHSIVLGPGENEISIKALDLLGKETTKIITILVDQEGPMIYFGEPKAGEPGAQNLIEGALFDPSEIKQLFFNGERVVLTRIEIPEDSKKSAFFLFQYPISFADWEESTIHYRAEDILHNITEGTIRILEGKIHEGGSLALSFSYEYLQIAMASRDSSTTLEAPLFQIAKRRPSPVRIIISNVPEETFEEEITAQIEILAQSQIREVYVNGESILSDYGLSWERIFASIGKYLWGERMGRFSFPKVLKLPKLGENIINVKVVDRSEEPWEEEKRIVKKIKQVRKLEERWRLAIPLLNSYQWGDKEIKENKDFTYQLMDAFITQERFNIIDTMNLPILIEEKNLHDFIEHPYLGLKKQSRIWIDVFLFGYVHQSRDSINMFASLIDLETGEILATKDVFEKMDSIIVSKHLLQKHFVHNCYALANKFKEHFPLCEGKVISLNRDELITTICKSDGLKRGMKLILFQDQPLYEDHYEGEDFKIVGEVKVKEVSEQHSKATPLQELEVYDLNNISINFHDISKNLGAITR